MKKIIDGQIVDTDKMSTKDLDYIKDELTKKQNELKIRKNKKGIEDNVKLFETVITDWLESIRNLITIDAAIFVKYGDEEIENKINDAKKALESRGSQYGLSYEQIVHKYNLDSEKEGNLLGNYKISLINLNNVYKKAYKSILDVKSDAYKELRKTYEFIIKLEKEKSELQEHFIDYKKYEKKIQDLTKKAKKAIEEGNQKKALEISSQISDEKEKNPLKEYDKQIILLNNQKDIYEEVLNDCQKQLNNYYNERKEKLDKAIIIEPIENKALVVNKKKFWDFWKK